MFIFNLYHLQMKLLRVICNISYLPYVCLKCMDVSYFETRPDTFEGLIFLVKFFWSFSLSANMAQFVQFLLRTNITYFFICQLNLLFGGFAGSTCDTNDKKITGKRGLQKILPWLTTTFEMIGNWWLNDCYEALLLSNLFKTITLKSSAIRCHQDFESYHSPNI